MLRDFAIACSLSNLCFILGWDLLTPSKSVWMTHAVPLAYAAMIANVFMLAVVFWLAIRLARRSPKAVLPPARWILPLVLLVVVANGLRQALGLFPEGLGTNLGRYGLALAGLGGAASVVILVLLRRRIVSASITVVLIAFPFALYTIGSAVYSILKLSVPTVEMHTTASLSKDRVRSHTRVVWLLFDELDQRTILQPPPSIPPLPELDRFARESIEFTQAQQPGPMTRLSVPTLLTGRRVSASRATSNGTFVVTFAGTDREEVFRNQPNIFSWADEKGLATAVVGWFLPYCSLVGIHVTSCVSEEYWSHFRDSSFGQILWAELRESTNAIPLARRFEIPLALTLDAELRQFRKNHLRSYQKILDAARKVVANPDLDLVYIHWPIPHPPGIYSRKEGQPSLDFNSMYVDNLTLADRTFGELRQLMEQSGIWDDTAVFVTSDHEYRSALWAGESFSDSGVPDLPVNRLVTFMVKTTHQIDGRKYEEEYDSVLTSALLHEVLTGVVSTPDEVVEWLHAH